MKIFIVLGLFVALAAATKPEGAKPSSVTDIVAPPKKEAPAAPALDPEVPVDADPKGAEADPASDGEVPAGDLEGEAWRFSSQFGRGHRRHPLFNGARGFNRLHRAQLNRGHLGHGNFNNFNNGHLNHGTGHLGHSILQNGHLGTPSRLGLGHLSHGTGHHLSHGNSHHLSHGNSHHLSHGNSHHLGHSHSSHHSHSRGIGRAF